MATCANEGCDKPTSARNAKFCSTACRHDNWNRRRRTGPPRPRREPGAGPAPVSTVQVPQELYEAMIEMAEREGIPRAAVARRAITAYLEAEGVQLRAS